MDRYSFLTPEQQSKLSELEVTTSFSGQDTKRIVAGGASDVVRGTLDFYNMIKKPTASEREKTEEFLKNLYTHVVGSENVVKIMRGEEEVTEIAEPENAAASFVRDIGAFTGSFLGVGKVTKPIEGLKAIKKFTAVAPKTTGFTKLFAKGEAAAQLSMNPYEENLANVLGSMIDDDRGDYLNVLEEYFLDPLKSSEEKTELENRIALLGEGAALAGVFGVAGSVASNPSVKEVTSKATRPLINSMRAIASKGADVSKSFINAVREASTISADRDLRNIAEQKLSRRVITTADGKATIETGDIDALNSIMDSAKFSTNNYVRNAATLLGQTFTSRGGLSYNLFNRKLQRDNAIDEWNALITHTGDNFEKSINDIYRSLGPNKNKKELLDEISNLLFDDRRLFGIITSKGYVPPVSQSVTFNKGLTKYPRATREAIKKARDLQDRLSRLLLQDNNVPAEAKEIIEDGLGVYTRESYRLFEDNKYIPTTKVDEDARNFIRSEIVRKDPTLSNIEVNSRVNATMEDLAGGKGEYAGLIDDGVGFNKTGKGLLKKRKTIPDEIKAYYSKVDNPIDRIVLSTKKIAKFVEDNKFYRDAWRDGQNIYFYTKKTKPVGFNARIGKGYGELTGKYTTPQLRNYFEGQTGLASLVEKSGFLSEPWRVALFLKAQSQRSATVRRLPTHLKNVIGNTTLTAASGINPFNIKKITSSFRALTPKTNQELQLKFQEYSKQGILNKNAVLGDLRLLMDEGSKSKTMERILYSKPIEYIKNTPIARGLLKGDEKVLDLYMFEDDIFKVYMYNTEKENLVKYNSLLPKGDQFDSFRMSTEQIQNEAGRKTRDSLPNYALIPDNMKGLRVVPLIGKFFSFASESVRLAMTIPTLGFNELGLAYKLKQAGADKASNYVRNRAMKRLTGYGFFGVGGGKLAADSLSSIGNAAAGVSQDTLDNLKPLLPDYQQNDNLLYTYNEDGDPIVTNISSWDAFDFPRKTFTSLLFGLHEVLELKREITDNERKKYLSNTITELFEPFLGTSLPFEVINNYVFNDGADENGRLMSMPNNPLIRYQTKQASDVFPAQFNPDNLYLLTANLIDILKPGSYRDLERYLDRKSRGDFTEYEEKIDPGLDIIRLLTGFDSTIKNKESLEVSYNFKAREFLTERNKHESTIYRSILDTTTADQLAEIFLKENRKYYELAKDFYNLNEKVNNLDINTAKLMDEINGFSNLDITAFSSLGRKFVPIKLTDSMIRHMQDKTILSDTAELYKAINKIRLQSEEFAQLDIIVDPKDLEMKREGKAKGGLVKGEDNVPYTKDNPADRINPYTGQSYTEGVDFMEEPVKEPRDRFALGGSIYRYLEGKFSELAGLKTDDISWAKEQGKAYGAAQELDGKGDAKRHILLGWLAKQSPSPRVASLGIKAREFIDPSGRKMDEFNNQLGYTFPDSIETREDAIKEADRLIESNQALFYTPKESRQMRGY